MQQSLTIEYDSKSIKFIEDDGYESRNQATSNLIKKAWNKYIRNTGHKNSHISIFTGDSFNTDFNYSYACYHLDSKRSFPSFIFDCWPECGIENYDDVCHQIKKTGKNPVEDHRVFWIGAGTHPYRTVGCQLSNDNDNLAKFILMGWNRSDPNNLYKNTEEYISLPDHAKYRVLIDFPGCGFSARIPVLLFSGRPVILVGRTQEQWYYWSEDFIPWKHYIPCGLKDGSDFSYEKLLETIRWTFDNPEKCEEIGKNGQQYASDCLSSTAIIDKIGQILLNN